MIRARPKAFSLVELPVVSKNKRAAFSLVELLVVIGIIALLIGILLPAMSRVRQSSKQVTCMANMRTIGQLLLAYANENNGWVYPLGPDDNRRLGGAVDETERWPVRVKGLERYDHPLLFCPSDENPAMEHSYALNWHIAQRNIRFHSSNLGGLKSGEVVVMGEKRQDNDHYFIDGPDYDEAADPYKHGLRLGSNYLFLDLHVALMQPKQAPGSYDPWDVNPDQ
jgi:prepilin-type processing-associated H-X9-DG protein